MQEFLSITLVSDCAECGCVSAEFSIQSAGHPSTHADVNIAVMETIVVLNCILQRERESSREEIRNRSWETVKQMCILSQRREEGRGDHSNRNLSRTAEGTPPQGRKSQSSLLNASVCELGFSAPAMRTL